MNDNNEHLLLFYDAYKDNRNKWGIGLNKLNIHIDNYKTNRTKLFLYVLWNILIFIYMLEFFVNLFFLLSMSHGNLISKSILSFSLLDSILVILLTSQGLHAYSKDKSIELHKCAQYFHVLSIWCSVKLLLYIFVAVLSFAILPTEKLNHLFYFYGTKGVYFNYFIEIVITFNVIKSVLTFFTGQKIQYIFSCIRTSTILKSKIRKDLEKQSFLFEDYTYGTFITDFRE
ncbi:conserved Plasmodium protein, unknown function [Plasmodium knowlesi strain H]|uniref:Uncharacterized protein n=3 Tax=Plasmodium knowlesi TaxID=5850 RepID=A0A5K1TZL1_PLAKH|nr:conserved Plasmodium protein, unknown function [Plasmodium knowlesi strain H]OTN65827.1 Uncharacterized protein PKNOH_S100032400 [Plasmodium knowlesi]CAA9987689.1 conserved Plasmodium protein, unknown function [Plasmodium knowlesi strain H]SBO26907.1 conserved Plasmodium protein, unknown function [Plasmodium knowlesi strain H]SBO29633.1 conserved Plasmodium protein, unknown function [Plasmodium knowlesi strain H]VVS77163.1 conserved Plasmodium protein, unknown function [Plasmodium knowlesi |eukprot:XP_002258687.1 hypothetical protein, conserved [Plasmodium knowlesi strain H]